MILYELPTELVNIVPMILLLLLPFVIHNDTDLSFVGLNITTLEYEEPKKTINVMEN